MTYLRGDVVMIPSAEGISSDSHVKCGTRPYIIVQNNIGNRHSPTTLVVPLTTRLKKLDQPTHVVITWGNLRTSMANCEQVRVVDIADDWQYMCSLPAEIMCHVDDALKNAFWYEGGDGDGNGN